MTEDRITHALRTGHKLHSRARTEITDPDLRDSVIEKPDNPESEHYGPRNPSVKQASQRYSKEQVDYTDHAKGKEDCDDCRHFDGDGACELVKGLIKPEGWCRKFTAKNGDNDEQEES